MRWLVNLWFVLIYIYIACVCCDICSMIYGLSGYFKREKTKKTGCFWSLCRCQAHGTRQSDNNSPCAAARHTANWLSFAVCRGTWHTAKYAATWAPSRTSPCVTRRVTRLAHGEVNPDAVNSGRRRLWPLFRRVPGIVHGECVCRVLDIWHTASTLFAMAAVAVGASPSATHGEICAVC